ncbi:MAG: CheR family methyltransferase [Syntrophobacteraceae bacterium]|jgi:chemotaxis protein methyltransferase CheR
MASSVSEGTLSRLSAFVASKMGLWFPEERWRDLERGLNSVARELDFKDSEDCVEWLLSSPVKRSHIEVLASHLTVGETYFFRNKKIFQLLEENVLPELIQVRRENGKHVRIWSAGCSTGEEPYSIAILLSRMIPDLGDWNITILATDINPRFLRTAAAGLYRRWSFRDIAPRIEEEFFNKKGDRSLEVLSRIRKMVTFSYLNLVEDTYPSLFNNTNAMDIIFCRNVLMYLVPERARKVVENLHRSLLDGGCLIVSPTELSPQLFPQFAPVSLPGAMIYRKESSSSRAAGHFPCMPPDEPIVPFMPAVEPVPGLDANEKSEAGDAQLIPHETRDLQPATQSLPPGIPLPDDLYSEALALYEAGCYAHAMGKTESLLSHYPSDAGAMALVARILANSGKLAEALQWCEKAISTDKLKAGSHYLIATIHLELGQTEAATLSLKRALYLDPNFILAYVALGNISRQRHRHRESVKYFENALSLLTGRNPEDILPESEEVNVGRLTEIIENMLRAAGRR